MPFVKVRRAVLVAGLVILVLVLLSGWRTYSYVQHDPSFCTSCHIMDDAYDRWSGSVHSEVTCHACHATDLKANLRQLWVYWTAPPEKPKHRAEVENSTCYQCHREGGPDADFDHATDDPNWKHVLGEAGHAEHVSQQRIQCIRCHSLSVHRFVPTREICTSCHKHEGLEKTKMDEHCTACHPYTLAGRKSLKPERADCLGCHQEMQVDHEVFPEVVKNGDAEYPMRWECGKCHKPHDKPHLAALDCKGCHEKKISGSALHQVETHDECVSCHLPHLWMPVMPATCGECHDKDEEHTGGEACTDCHD